MRNNVRNLALALSVLGLSAMPATAQPRPDHVQFGATVVDNEAEGKFAGIGRAASIPFTYYLGAMFCRGSVHANDAFAVYLLEPELFKVGPKSAKVVQKAFVVVEAAAWDEANMTSFFDVPPTAVESCSGSITGKDDDKDGDLDGGTDVLTASYSCGKDLPTLFGFNETQTQAFIATFGDKPACKITGVPIDGGFCFRGDTIVSTEQGPRPIRDLSLGDRVWSFDEAAGREVLQPVTRIYRRPGTALREVGAGTETIRTTDEHPFRVEGRGWVKARDLAVGDRLVSRGEAGVAVAFNRSVDASTFYAGYVAPQRRRAGASASNPQLERVSVATTDLFRAAPPLEDSGAAPVVYNIEVGGLHNYFVGAGRILVHNK
ncbi:MAG TPA: Hint domain-containing protein [Candidatus Limnocylindrales bacterium]|nr:Hint domain-containing protein [Candidatus Limnocylindrales bacterium]